MSSYFDRMGRCMDSPKEFFELVRDQYRWYLTKLSQEVLIKDLGRLNELMFRFDKDFRDFPGREVYHFRILLSNMHSFAHDLAMANIRLKGGRRAMDNPPIPY